MEEAVKDAVLLGQFQDLVLLRLVELTVWALRSERPLFPSLLEEPAFFRRRFQAWVQEALAEKERLDASQKDSLLEIE